MNTKWSSIVWDFLLLKMQTKVTKLNCSSNYS